MVRVRIDQPIQPNGRVEFQDGTAYRVRNGYADVPADKARAIKQSNLGTTANFNALHGAGVVCGCGFHAWAWSNTCPKCGAALR